MQKIYKKLETENTREIKQGINSGLVKVIDYLESIKIDVSDEMLDHVASISCNNDKELGSIISAAYKTVGKDGVVLMETSETEETYVETVDGVQFDSGITSPHFITNTEKQKAELDNPLILMCMSEIPNIRKIQGILEHVIKQNRSLLIIAPVSQQVKSALLMNKVKGNIKINIISPPGFGPTKKDTCEDLAILTGSTLFNEELGDDLDAMQPEDLGEAEYATTDDRNTVITTIEETETNVAERINHVGKLVSDEKNGFIKKKDRVEDAIYATKAALKEGIVPGGGIALLNASTKIKPTNEGEKVLLEAIRSPFEVIMSNAGFEALEYPSVEGVGVNVVTGEEVDMVKSGIIDPVLVTKSALKNAVSVASTIISADCVISNIRINEGS